MTRLRVLAASFLSCLHVAFLSAPKAEAQGLVTEDLRIPMAAAGPAGLEAVLVKPSSPGAIPSPFSATGRPATGTPEAA